MFACFFLSKQSGEDDLFAITDRCLNWFYQFYIHMGRTWRHAVYGTYRRHVGGTLYCSSVTSNAASFRVWYYPPVEMQDYTADNLAVRIFRFPHHTLRIPPTWRHRFNAQFSGVTFTSFFCLLD